MGLFPLGTAAIWPVPFTKRLPPPPKKKKETERHSFPNCRPTDVDARVGAGESVRACVQRVYPFTLRSSSIRPPYRCTLCYSGTPQKSNADIIQKVEFLSGPLPRRPQSNVCHRRRASGTGAGEGHQNNTPVVM